MSEETIQAAVPEESGKKGLSPVTKAAAVVVAMGAESASSVYKYLREDEIEAISLEVARLKHLPTA